ncbi:Hypothetical predicted protein [Podarcis lilfordi]|uniref:Uncharacterized protein n=1 Tax=Podarcis lilfordi TaxID=74358 RepID=A0AA35KZL0_9SAUR|nr:Hypothetical predicted protein [Podarcis lilfordi]
MLACIHSFTKSCVSKQHLVIWKGTVALLEGNCGGYSENNGSQKVEVRFRNTTKCIMQRKEKCGTHTSKELEEMWNSYMRI